MDLGRGTPDVGQAALHRIHAQLQIEDGSSIWSERSFSWAPHRLTQNYSALTPYLAHGSTISDVTATVVVVDDVRAHSADVLNAIVRGNATAVGNAWTYLPEFRQIVSTAAHSVGEETLGADAAELGAYGILQLCEAEWVADTVAESVGGRTVLDSHNGLPKRDKPDGMLAVPSQVFIPDGSKPSHFSSISELNAVHDYFANSRFASLGPSAEGICIEVPFGQDRTVLVRLGTNSPHPWLGNGLAVDTFVPGVGDVSRMMLSAITLQELQMGTVEGGGRLGAWTLKEINGGLNVAWTRFVPNTLFLPGVTLNVAIGEVARAIWIDKLFHPGLPERNAWDVLEARARAGGYFGVGHLPELSS